MKRNFNKPEAFIRLFLGIILVVIAFSAVLQDVFVDNVLLGIGFYLIATAPFHFCLLYAFLGIDKTNKKNKPKMY